MNASFVNQQFELVSHFLYHTVLPKTHWPLLNELVVGRIEQTTGTTTMYGATLPLLTAHATGGDTGPVVPLAGAWFLYNLASDLFDDLQDGDRKSVPWAAWKADQILMAGVGLFFVANGSLAELHVPEDARREIERSWAQVGLTAAREQVTPLGSLVNGDTPPLAHPQIPSLDGYLRHIAAKSGLILSAVAWAGGRAISAHPDKLAHLRAFGQALGMIVQLRDDIIDIAAPPDTNDLRQGHWTLPLLFGLNQKDHPMHARLQALCQSPHTQLVDRIIEVQTLLDEMHAFTFAAAVVRTYERKAIDALAQLSPVPDPHLLHYVEALSALFAGHPPVYPSALPAEEESHAKSLPAR
jgi:heptaprenyl diphosphate synthase